MRLQAKTRAKRVFGPGAGSFAEVSRCLFFNLDAIQRGAAAWAGVETDDAVTSRGADLEIKKNKRRAIDSLLSITRSTPSLCVPSPLCPLPLACPAVSLPSRCCRIRKVLS